MGPSVQKQCYNGLFQLKMRERQLPNGWNSTIALQSQRVDAGGWLHSSIKVLSDSETLRKTARLASVTFNRVYLKEVSRVCANSWICRG